MCIIFGFVPVRHFLFTSSTRSFYFVLVPVFSISALVGTFRSFTTLISVKEDKASSVNLVMEVRVDLPLYSCGARKSNSNWEQMKA